MRWWLNPLTLSFLALSAPGAALAEPMGEAGSRRPLTRAGFVPSESEVAHLARHTHTSAVQRLLARTATVAATPPPDLRRLDDDGNLRHTVDFRRVYATVLEHHWQQASEPVLLKRFAPLPFLRA